MLRRAAGGGRGEPDRRRRALGLGGLGPGPPGPHARRGGRDARGHAQTGLADAGCRNEAELARLEERGVDACVAPSRESRPRRPRAPDAGTRASRAREPSDQGTSWQDKERSGRPPARSRPGGGGPGPRPAPGEGAARGRPPPRGAGGCLTMSCSRMGKPHTAIGDAPFHFRVRDGFGWVRRSMVVRRIPRPPRASAPGGRQQAVANPAAPQAPPTCVNRRQAGGPRLWRRDPLRNPGAPARGRCCYAAKPHGRLVRVS